MLITSLIQLELFVFQELVDHLILLSLLDLIHKLRGVHSLSLHAWILGWDPQKIKGGFGRVLLEPRGLLCDQRVCSNVLFLRL